MANTVDEMLAEQLASPQPEQPAAPEAGPVPEAEAGLPVPAEDSGPKQRRSILLPLLTILLILLGLGEAGFWGLFGLSAYQNSLARERYEAQQQALEEERAAGGAAGSSSFGPNFKVENGSVIWQREDVRLSSGTGTSGSSTPSQGNGGEEKRLSSLSVPNVPYTLADMDPEDSLPPSEQAPESQNGGTAPASA
ncbi:MAG: hypothetical protein HFF59_00225 [Lawsonibacter sp.]|nr:hypothetical protein [Lawsonibacter sp.]